MLYCMRYWICSLFLTLLSILQGAPVGNTAAPQLLEKGFFIPSSWWINVRAGYEGDFVGDAFLKQTKESTGRIDQYSQNTNSGTFTLNFLDRVDLFATFGSSAASANWRFIDAQNVVSNVEIQTLQNFLWRAGTRIILFEWGSCNLGFGGSFSEVKNTPSWLTIDGVSQSVANTHLHWREWQVHADVSYRIQLLTPYIGVKYSNVQTKLGTFPVPISANGSGNNHFTNRIPVGLFVGVALSTGKYFMLNVEGRLIDEEAVTVSGDLRF